MEIRGIVVVEQHKAGGATTHKRITPQVLCDCVLTSCYDNERRPTGLLPEGCIAVAMENVYYFIRYPKLYADITYYDTEYRDLLERRKGKTPSPTSPTGLSWA